MTELVRYESAGTVAKITMDDGKVNVMSVAMLQALHGAFDRAEKEEAIVLLTGRPGIFSAGFDLKVFASNDPGITYMMMKLGSELALRLMTFPMPVVTACTGNAFPMGAFLMLASDLRLAAEGPYRIGLNEVAIGLTVPSFAIELARSRLTPAFFSRTAVLGEMFAPQEARQAGFVDHVVPQEELLRLASEAAETLTKIDLRAHAETKTRARGAAAQAVGAAIRAEITLEAYRRQAMERLKKSA